jgi:hypothetical protein
MRLILCTVGYLLVIGCSGPVKPEAPGSILGRLLAMPEVVLPPETPSNRTNQAFIRTRDECLVFKEVRDEWFAIIAFYDHPDVRYSWDGRYHHWERLYEGSLHTLRAESGDSFAFTIHHPYQTSYGPWEQNYEGSMKHQDAQVEFQIRQVGPNMYCEPFEWSMDGGDVRFDPWCGAHLINYQSGGGSLGISSCSTGILHFSASWDACGHGRANYEEW